jgi:hypothetical protein
MLNKIRNVIKLLWDVMVHAPAGDIPYGVDMTILWGDTAEQRVYYASFGEVDWSNNADSESEPLWDTFGVADDEVFYYFTNKRELLKTIIQDHHDGWKIIQFRILWL